MPLTARHTVLVLLFAVVPIPAGAQVISEGGTLSGSGLAYLPTTGLVPVSQWRSNYARVDYTGAGLKGINVMSLSCGLSTHIEGYVKLTGEQLGTIASLTSYSFGVKAILPIELPVLEAVGLWFEEAVSDEIQQSQFFPADATRGGVTASMGGPAFRGVLLAGVNSVGGKALFLSGAGVAWAPGSGTKLSAEVLNGYYDQSSFHAALSLAARVIPHVVLLASPGYIRTSAAETWSMSVGLSVSTADVDFRPSALTARKGDFKLPSLEDIMKESSEEKKQ